MPTIIKPYTCVADIYPHLMSFINYKEWAEYYYFLTKKVLKPDSKVLELAAGNCSLAVNLKTYYPNLFVSDNSFEMLRKCKDKSLNKICCDMNNLPFRKEYDFIFSAFDSINYLLTKKALGKLFRQVNNLLADKGMFSFDVSLESNSIKNIRYLNRIKSYDGISYIQKSFYDKVKRIHYNKFILKYPDGREIEELHRQRIFPLEIYLDLLINNGFNIQNCYDAFSFNDATNKSFRIQIIAVKN
jgi:hypothetical protein